MKNTITGYTGLYGVVANPIKHSFSPMMHNTAFQTLGINDVYLAFEVTKDQLDDYITSVKTLPIKGYNISMPYKQDMMKYMDELTTQARLAKSINTVKNENGKLIGHITDGEGFVMACRDKGWGIAKHKIVVLGAGGAASAIIISLALAGAKEIVVYNRSDKPFIKELNKKLDCPITLKKIDQESIKEDLKDTYLLVNTTSVGMAPHPEGCIIESADMLPDGLKVADIIYNPKETKLLSYARQRGLDYMNGERMIVYQGACSFKFWAGKDMPIHEVKVALGMEESE